MRRPKNIQKRLIKYIVLALAGVGVFSMENTPQRIVDGDTIRLGRERVRLTGIDAPEMKQTCVCGGKTVSCGVIAKQKLSTLVDGRKITCKTSGRDYYGRLLGECFAGEINLNARMVADGWARVPDRYPSPYTDLETTAIKEKRGLWHCEKYEAPADFRRSR